MIVLSKKHIIRDENCFFVKPSYPTSSGQFDPIEKSLTIIPYAFSQHTDNKTIFDDQEDMK